MQINDAQFDDLLPLYVLGALEPDELAAMEAYIDAHPAAQAEVAQARQVAALLAWTPPQHDPPASLRERVLDRVQGEPPATRPQQPRFWQWVRDALRPPVARMGLAMSAALLLATLVLGARTWQVQQQVQQQQALIQLFQSPNMQVASLAAPDVSTDARAQIAFDPNGQTALVVASNLPRLPATQTYQFWLIADQPVSGGVFQVDEHGVGRIVVDAGKPLEQYQKVGISREPAGGSATPTTNQIVLLGNLPRPQ